MEALPPIDAAEPRSADRDAGKPKTERAFPTWPVVVGSFGLAAIGVGLGFLLDSRAAEQSLVEHCGDDLVCPRGTGYDLAGDNARKNRGFGVFVGLTGAGAVAIGAASIGMIVHRAKKPSAPSVGLSPVVSPSFGGALFSGRF